jgi:uncharacterized membrane protein YdjX (TVP38/TMEM64 family)
MKSKILESLKYIIVLCLLITGMILFFKYKNQLLDFNYMKKFVLGYGRFAEVIIILIFIVKPICVLFPSNILSILAGSIFGFWEALILSIIGWFLSATISFLLARKFGQTFVNKVLKGKALKLDDDIEKHGFKIMLIMRLSCVFPYDALSYGAGLTKMRYIDFILATMIGVAPSIIAYAVIGKNIGNVTSNSYLEIAASIIIVIAIAVISYLIYKKRGKTKASKEI